MIELATLNYIKRNLDVLKQLIEKASRKANRNTADIKLVAVTKNVNIDKVEHLIALGINDFGENRVPELVKKTGIVNSQVNWHMIGHLQTNKVRKGLPLFDYLHSLDSLHLAEMIEKEAAILNKKLNVFIQVNVSGEETKSGIKPEETKEFYGKIRGFTHLNIIGLMTMAPEVEDVKITRPVFRKLRELSDYLRMELTGEERINFKHLSMGMSNDFEVAVEEGATFLRIGTALFNPDRI